MAENKNQIKSESETSEEIPNQKNEQVDMQVSKHKETILDSETMILETQKRVWGALKKGYEYSGMVDESEQ